MQDLAVLDSGNSLRQHLHPGPDELGQVLGRRLPRGVHDLVSPVAFVVKKNNFFVDF